MHKCRAIAERQRALAEEQRNEAINGPADMAEVMEAHKQVYFQMMDLQARKAEDIVNTGGDNLPALRAEEAALQQEADVRFAQTRAKARELFRAMGDPATEFLE